jgi:hypothetical protein
MIRFGYDQFDDDTWEIIKPNGLIGQEEVPETYRLYLPPWYGEIFIANEIPFKIRSSEQLIKENHNDKWIYLLEPNGDPRGWFGMFEDENPNPIKSLFAGVDKKTISSCRDDKTIICLWQPNEGFPSEWININVFEEIYKELDKCGISPNNFIYVCGNWKIEKEFKEWKNNKTEYYKDWKNIHLCAFNNERYLNFKKKWGGELSKFNSSIKRERHYVCFNRELRPHRKLFLTMLLEANLLEYGMVSSKKFDIETFFRVPKELNLGKGLSKKLQGYAEKLVDMTPMVVDVDEWDTNHFDTSNKWVYDATYFSLITTTWFGEDTVFFDEKIWKPMANEHPFLVIGNYQVLKELKRQGFKTFHPYIDESYDEEKNPYKRMKMIIKETKRLSKLTLDEMNEWYKKLQPILEHNNKQLYSLDSLDELTAKFKEIIKGK